MFLYSSFVVLFPSDPGRRHKLDYWSKAIRLHVAHTLGHLRSFQQQAQVVLALPGYTAGGDFRVRFQWVSRTSHFHLSALQLALRGSLTSMELVAEPNIPAAVHGLQRELRKLRQKHEARKALPPIQPLTAKPSCCTPCQEVEQPDVHGSRYTADDSFFHIDFDVKTLCLITGMFRHRLSFLPFFHPSFLPRSLASRISTQLFSLQEMRA